MTIVETPRGYEVNFEYRPMITAEVKAIPGARFFGKDRGWLIPHVAEIKQADNTIVRVQNKPLVEKLRSKHVRLAEGADAPEEILTISELPELELKLNLKLPPFPYQNQGIARGNQLKRFINGDQPGLGKTLQAIGTVLSLDSFPCLVICPSTLKENWRREWEEKFTHKRALVLSDKNKNTWHQYYRLGLADVIIVNYESLKKYFVSSITTKKGSVMKMSDIQYYPTINLFKSVVIDEIHRLKDYSTQQCKFARGITFGKDVVVGLTGTPVVNKPKDLISQLAIINRLHEFGGKRFFLDRYCQGGSGSAKLNELNARLNNICFFRREKKDVLKDLPDKTREVVLCDIVTQTEYNQVKHEFVQYLNNSGYSQEEIARKLRGEIMVKIQMLKKISAMGKMAEVIDHVQEVVDAGEKIVLFIHHKEIAQILMSQYPEALTVRGGDSREERDSCVHEFQACKICNIKHQDHDYFSPDHEYVDNNHKIIICSIKAAGVGITLTASSRLCFVELPWHPADVEQCEDRIHRIGQKNAAQITYFLGKGTIDEDIYKLIETKRKVSNTITGASDDVEVMIRDITRTLFKQG